MDDGHARTGEAPDDDDDDGLSAEDRQLWGAQMIAMARDGNLDLAALEQVLAQPPWHPSRSDPSAVTEIPLRFIVCSDDARAELAGPVQVSSLPTLLKLLELPPLRSQAARTIGRACAAAEEAGPQAVAALAAHAWALARGTHALLAAVCYAIDRRLASCSDMGLFRTSPTIGACLQTPESSHAEGGQLLQAVAWQSEVYLHWIRRHTGCCPHFSWSELKQ
jgi:hypothetical protein